MNKKIQLMRIIIKFFKVRQSWNEKCHPGLILHLNSLKADCPNLIFGTKKDNMEPFSKTLWCLRFSRSWENPLSLNNFKHNLHGLGHKSLNNLCFSKISQLLYQAFTHSSTKHKHTIKSELFYFLPLAK